MISEQGRQLCCNRFDVSDNENDTQFRDGRKWFVLYVQLFLLNRPIILRTKTYWPLLALHCINDRPNENEKVTFKLSNDKKRNQRGEFECESFRYFLFTLRGIRVLEPLSI